MHRIIGMVMGIFSVCSCSAAMAAPGLLESPGAGSFQSGQGVIYGWVCEAKKIELVVDNSITVEAPYGTLRTDTQTVCGDANNGFAFGVNWNNLGDGTHTLVVKVDGQQLGKATFTVVTFGQNVLPDKQATYILPNFPESGATTTVLWSEALQNFVIAGTQAAGPPICKTKEVTIFYGTARATLTFAPSCDGQRIDVQVSTPATNLTNIFICESDFAFGQNNSHYQPASDFYWILPDTGETVCGYIGPARTVQTRFVLAVGTQLNFSQPFALEYQHASLINFP